MGSMGQNRGTQGVLSAAGRVRSPPSPPPSLPPSLSSFLSFFLKFTKEIMLKNLGTTICKPKLGFINEFQVGTLNDLGLLVAMSFSTLKLLPRAKWGKQ